MATIREPLVTEERLGRIVKKHDNSTKNQSMSSLLARALEVPSLNHPTTMVSSFHDYDDDSNSSSTPVHKDHMMIDDDYDGDYDHDLDDLDQATPPTSNPAPITRYDLQSPSVIPQPLDEMMFIPQHSDFTIPTSNARFVNGRKVDFALAPPLEITPPGVSVTNERRSVFGGSVERRYQVPKRPTLSPPESPPQVTRSFMIQNLPVQPISPLTPARTTQLELVDEFKIPSRRLLYHRTTFHETVHAQSLLLGIAFMAIWSPNNAMAPNLTQIATSFDMSEAQRDLYLGSYCALALGVFCLPISALLGFMADFYSRKWLFVCCVVGGSLASAWTGWSQTFPSLFWARLISGGCMSASVPVAFSLLGDLFATEERNAASSGLTAMMGMGILLGQVYAGTIGPSRGWQFPFFASSILSLSTALLVILWVREPERGAKEKALQGLIQSGNKYERQLTLSGFVHAMRHNRSNGLLLWSGFFTSLPWGIVFVFLNDYLSQEKGFSVPDATFMVMLFGVGCAIGGILGGYIGQKCQAHNRALLPLYMAATTFLGILPFIGLLNSQFPNKHGYKAMAYSILGGCIASLPSVNVRPCILNVNPPETRGAALTAANLLVTLGRGMGPSCITLMGSFFDMSRQSSFNATLTIFWTITAIQLVFLAKTLPEDQDNMEEGLARYAAELALQQESGRKQNLANRYGTTTLDEKTAAVMVDKEEEEESRISLTPRSTSSDNLHHPHLHHDDGESLVSIEDYINGFDGPAARRSFQFVQQGFKEIKEEMAWVSHACGPCRGVDDSEQDDHHPNSDVLEEILPQEELRKRQNLWKRQQQQQVLLSQDATASSLTCEKDPTEQTPLLRIV